VPLHPEVRGSVDVDIGDRCWDSYDGLGPRPYSRVAAYGNGIGRITRFLDIGALSEVSKGVRRLRL
jgi:hypothetical protein